MTDVDFGPFLKKRKNGGKRREIIFFQFFLSLLVAYSENGVLSSISAKNNKIFDFFQK